MTAVVRLHLTLIEMAGGRRELTVDTVPPVRLAALLDRWGVPRDEVGIIVRNRKRESIDCLIEAGDLVELFPILSGG